MSLPSGYKRLEYIKSSGSQYVDTGIQPTQNTRIDLKVSTSQTGSHTIAGADISWAGNGFGIGVGFAHYGTQTAFINGMNDGSVHDISLNKNVLSVDGEVKHTFSSQTFSVGYNLMLFANNRSGSKEELTEATLYACKIYDNDTIIRDYIPCQTNTGETGLWDDISSTFYGNSGTDAFVAGPIIAIAVSADNIIELQYITSNGGQYLDSGFYPDQDTKVEMDAQAASIQSIGAFWFGTRTSSASKAFNAALITSGFWWGYHTTSGSVNFSANKEKLKVIADKNVLSVSGSITAQSTQNYGVFRCTHSLILLALWENSGIYTNTQFSGNTYSCRIYDNGTLVRDYIAAKLTDGTVGLYDKLNGLLYINIGTGAFTAGPEVPKPPSCPDYLIASWDRSQSVQLTWGASDNAIGYRLYKNGQLISEQDSTSYTDNVKLFETIQYSVSAYNKYGECEPTTITFYATPDNPVLYLITDRTSADVSRAQELAKKLNSGAATVEELAEWNSVALKGSYDYTDLNRVGDAVQHLAGILTSLGYDCPIIPKLDWTESGSASPSDMAQYLENIQTLRGKLTLFSDTPNVPADIEKLTWQEANAIEQILVDLESTIKTMLKTRAACGDAYCGGEYL